MNSDGQTTEKVHRNIKMIAFELYLGYIWVMGNFPPKPKTF